MYSLRPYQRDACDAAWRWLNANAGNCVISLPTGAGKSLCIADLCRQTLEWGGRPIVLANRKELLQQNAEKIQKLIPSASLGIYSAGLNFRQTSQDVIVAGIQSIYKRAGELGARHLAIPDECHLIRHSDDGMYRDFLSDLRAINPELRVVGMTATPYRTGEGSLVRADGIFQGIAYTADLKELIAAGYLCPITNTAAEAEVDTSRLRVRAGEFVASDMEGLFGDSVKVRSACREIVSKTSSRRSVLLFCAGVDHAEKVAKEIETLTGSLCGVVTGDTPPLERSSLLERFKDGSIKYVSNCEVLTTGFDSPRIDAIAILRATMSPGLFCQMTGRGLRTHPEKKNCLLLDFGGNIKRHGPIDAIDFGKVKKDGSLHNPNDPFKLCPNCEEKLAPAVRLCECGFRFPPPPVNHDETADSESQVISAPEVWLVEEVKMARHVKRKGDGPNTLRVDFVCQRPDGNMIETVSEWVCLEHEGFARVKAVKWWKEHSKSECPEDIDEAIDLWERGALRMPFRIETRKEGHFKKIQGREFEDERPETWSEEAASVPWENVEEESPF